MMASVFSFRCGVAVSDRISMTVSISFALAAIYSEQLELVLKRCCSVSCACKQASFITGMALARNVSSESAFAICFRISCLLISVPILLVLAIRCVIYQIFFCFTNPNRKIFNFGYCHNDTLTWSVL